MNGADDEPRRGLSLTTSTMETHEGPSTTSQTASTDKALAWIYRIFFLLGAAILLPWNAMIVATPFFLERMEGSPLKSTFSSYFSAVYQLSSFLTLAHASYTAAQTSKSRRITLSHIFLTGTLSILFLSTLIPTQPLPFFLFSLTVGGIQASAGSYLLTAVVSYASYFGPLAMQSIMSGQAAVAVVVSIVQLITTITAMDRKPHPARPSLHNRSVSEISTSASYFFLVSTIGIVASFFAYRRLAKIGLFRQTVSKFEGAKHAESAVEYAALPDEEPTSASPLIIEEGEEATENDLLAMSTSIGSLREHERELSSHHNGLLGSVASLRERSLEGRAGMRELEPVVDANFWDIWKVNSMYNISVIIIYIVTLAMYPAITASIQTVNPNVNPQIFTATHFIVYNSSDWIGRIICSYPRFQVWSRKRLIAWSLARIGFVPLFLACNIALRPPSLSPRLYGLDEALYSMRRGETVAPLINSDVVFLVLLSAFGVSNGWLTSLVMMAAPSLEHNKRMRKEWVDVAAVGTSFSLAAGLVMGSLFNFAIRGMVCGCNPFVH